MTSSTKWLNILADILAISILFFFLYTIKSILPPFIIGFIIAWMLSPLPDTLQKKGYPRILSVLGVYTVFLAVATVGLVFLLPAVGDQAGQFGRDLPTYLNHFQHFIDYEMSGHKLLLAKLKLPTTSEAVIETYGLEASRWASYGLEHISKWIVTNLPLALWLILIPLSAFYFLNDMGKIRAKAPFLIPESIRPRALDVLSRVSSVFSNYIRGLAIVCLLYGIASTIVLLSFNLRYGIIIGIMAGLLYGVPYLGAMITTLLVFLVGLATFPGGGMHALWPTIGVVLLNQTFDYVITPRILGRSVGIHPLLSIFALMAGGELFGIVGMILAVPVAASIFEIVFEFYPQFRPEPKYKRPQKLLPMLSMLGKRKK